MAKLHLCSPAGFRASGVYAGIKSREVPDVGMIVCDTVASAAAAFTNNKVVAAPVIVGREHIGNGKLHGIVVNAGNANACTGKQGLADAKMMCHLAGIAVGCDESEILPSSTGIIGHLLPMDKIERGIGHAAHALGRDREHSLKFSDAILTTDLVRKEAATTVKIGGKTVIIAGVCKGSGMIGPRMSVPHATMLAYVTTDVGATPIQLRKALGRASDLSFNSVTVDDHTSTNDTCVLLASGMAGAKLANAKAAAAFQDALIEVCESLAYQIAKDGEGATKVVKILVKSATDEASATTIARTIANSPLVKCAMHGNDPNWGRIVSAAGYAGVAFDPDCCTLQLQGVTVFRNGKPAEFNAESLSRKLDKKDVNVVLDCRLGKGQAICFTCDLSKEYVTINADYHT